MKKVFFAFVAVATLALASCNNNAPATEETPTEETATTTEEAAPAAEEVAPVADSTAAATPAE